MGTGQFTFADLQVPQTAGMFTAADLDTMPSVPRPAPGLPNHGDTGEGPIARNLTSFENQASHIPGNLVKLLLAKHWPIVDAKDWNELAADIKSLNPVVKSDGETDWGATAANALPALIDLKGRGITESPAAQLISKMGKRAMKPVPAAAPAPVAPEAATPIVELPAAAEPPASTAAQEPRASTSPADVEKALNDALGGKPLERGVSLRNQIPALAGLKGKYTTADLNVPGLPEGFTPVDSSALRGYKYNPAANEFESITTAGQHYIHGDVSPEEAQTFIDADSKGRAWQQIRQNPLVAKVVNGTRVSVTPGTMQNAAGAVIPKASAGMEDLTDILKQSLEQAKGALKGKYTAVDLGAPSPARNRIDISAQPPTISSLGVSSVADKPATPNPGAGAEVGALPKPRPPSEPVATGSGTTIRVPGENQIYSANYEVRELADVQPSHSGITFQPNPKYALVNDRDYANPLNQGKVVTNAAPGKFDPSYHITDNPDATNGPIVIDSDGHALGGNGRAMILQRVYQSNPEGTAAYRKMLQGKALQFGVDPQAVAEMKQPVLVRAIPDADLAAPGAKQSAITDLNKVGTAQMTPAERAIADSRRVSQATLDTVAARLDSVGQNGTLGDALHGWSGLEVLNKLIDDGVITPQERAGLADQDGLTTAGKERVRRLIIGRFYRDPAQIDTTPSSIKNKLESIAAPLARVDGVAGWDLTQHVRDAMDLLEEARAHGSGNIDDVLSQQGIFGPSTKYSEEAIALAKQLKIAPARGLVKAARGYVQDMADAHRPMFSEDAVPPAQAFEERFGRRLATPGAAYQPHKAVKSGDQNDAGGQMNWLK